MAREFGYLNSRAGMEIIGPDRCQTPTWQLAQPCVIRRSFQNVKLCSVGRCSAGPERLRAGSEALQRKAIYAASRVTKRRRRRSSFIAAEIGM